MEFELVKLKTGVMSLRSLENKETFHPVTGPAIEARVLHVEQQRLLERSRLSMGKFIVWDVGLGAAANALVAIEALEDSSGQIELHSFDKSTAALEFALANAASLGYLENRKAVLNQLVNQGSVSITPRLKWFLHPGDFQVTILDERLPSPHAILYDPYSPVGNPEMWTLEHFTRIRNRLDPSVPCLLTNYSRSTAVRVTLLLAGFYVGIGMEVGEKAETSIASNSLESLRRPLRAAWLDRVKISRNSSPITASDLYRQGVISPTDFERLRRCPQFAFS